MFLFEYFRYEVIILTIDLTLHKLIRDEDIFILDSFLLRQIQS